MKFDYSYITEKNINDDDILLNKKEPIISVITPFYNGGKYIEDTAKAILKQTFPFFEWLIIDDGSKDEMSLKKLEEISRLDNRIKVYHKENTGLANTRDYGAKKSAKTTKYLFFLDDDDIIDTTYLECAYWTLETNKGASWAFTDVIHFGEYNALATTRYDPNHEIKQNVLVATALIKKYDFEKVGGYELKEKAINEDWNLWIKMIAAGMYPVRMSYFGFWYRRKVNNESELYRASKNKARTKEIISENAKKIKNPKPAIQYPKQDYKWDIMETKFDKIEVPKYKENNKTKILMIIPWMVIGGADKFNVDLLKGLDKSKFEITLITTEPNFNIWRDQFEPNTKAIYDLTSFLDRKYWLSFINYIINKNNIDIIFNSNSTFGYNALPSLKAENPDIPIIDYIHMEEWYNRNGGFSRDSSFIDSVIDKTFVCNNNSEKILVEHFKRNEKEIETVYIGVDEEKFNPEKYEKNKLKEKYKINQDLKVISFIARIDYQKRPLLFMEVLKKLLKEIDDVVIIIAGDGPLLSEIKNIAKKYNIEKNIKFLGAVKETAEIYSISDVTINCSIKEGLALTTYESLSMGVPVVSANVGGQSEIITDDVGVIVDCLQTEDEVLKFNYKEEEIDSYVVGIKKVLSNLEYYKKNARKRILNGFTINQMIENMSEKFKQIKENTNKKKIINAEGLKSNKKICLELITKYFIAFSNEYEWLAQEFNRKTDIEVNKSISNSTQQKLDTKDKNEIEDKNKLSKKEAIKRILEKSHIYNEIKIIYKIIETCIRMFKNIFKNIKNLVTDIFKAILKILKYIAVLVKLIGIRIINFFRTILKKDKIKFEFNDN